MDHIGSYTGYEIVIVTVDIADGKQDQIHIHELDEPALLARSFANKHNLSLKVEQALARNIQELIREFHKEQLVLSTSLSSKLNTSETQCKNFGQQLYMKGIKHKEQIEVNKQLLKMQIEKKITETASFKPVINEKSKKLAKNASHRSSADVRLKTPQEEHTDFTFSPRLNERSLKMASSTGNRIQRLYEEAELKRNRLQAVNETARKTEFPFKPNINHKGDYSSPEELVERLMNSKVHHYENLEELKKKYEVSKDPKTGQDFFKPNIGKSSKIQRNANNIWEYLYKFPKKTPENFDNYPYIPTKLDSKARSEKMLLKVKIDRYSEVFQQLNPDINGQIYFKNINTNEVHPTVLKIITPLLLELEEINQPLNFEEFVDSMENLLKTLNTSEKDVFLVKPKKKIEDQEHSIKKSTSSGDLTTLYQRHVDKKNLTSAKLEIEREKKKKLELEGCTFQPKTKKFPVHIFK
jgi:hypothetical protein